MNLLLRALVFLLLLSVPALGQSSPSTVVFCENGFPVADTTAPSAADIASTLPNASCVGAEKLNAALGTREARLLVLPYGSAFPEEAWPAIYDYLKRGGNLLVLGGMPFTRAAYRDGAGWKLRNYSVRFTQELGIDQYHPTPGSEGLTFEANPDLPYKVPAFAWARAFGPVIRLSESDVYKRDGSTGYLDAKLTTLAWGKKNGVRLAAPVMQIDHLQGKFTGGRWVFVSAELQKGAAADLLRTVADVAARGAADFSVEPTLPLYTPGEPLEVQVRWSADPAPIALTARVRVVAEQGGRTIAEKTSPVPVQGLIAFPSPAQPGLYFVEAELLDGNTVRARAHSGFWMRDEAYLRSGPKLSVNSDYFELDGKPLAVIGTTYMASDVQRLYFNHPNVYVWNSDMRHISGAGLNMLRTGWWTAWDKLVDENGQPTERTLRTLEAYLMTARKYGLPVQFTFFAFLPEVLGGQNAYLDPAAIRRQQTLVSAVAARFHDVPFLAYDLINEPSISQHLWKSRANGDEFERAAWNEWLKKRHRNQADVTAAWNETNGDTPLPAEAEFTPRSMYSGPNSLKLYDFYSFAQETFAGWTRKMRDAIRATGSKQLITVGQDEGGYDDRLSPAFFTDAVDFTTNHSWWQNDSLLWDSLVAKQPGKAMLIQETGVQRELTLDEVMRRSVENEATLFERKVALAFVQGSGTIEWLWNANSYMANANEAPIGAVRPDGTEKPEARVMRDFAAFAKQLQPHLVGPKQPRVAIVTSQAAQFSVMGNMQVEAQRNAVRALSYAAHVAGYVIAENQIDKLGSPALAILPSPQALSDHAWERLLQYVTDGGNLLITGPVHRDPYWHVVDRSRGLTGATVEPITYHSASLKLGDRMVDAEFGLNAQNWLESLRFADAEKAGETLREISHGKGHIYWAAYPVELADGQEATIALYSYVLERVGLSSEFQANQSIADGVLVFATELQDAMFYVFESERATDAEIDVQDRLTGTALRFNLGSQRAALAVISKTNKQIVARYGF